MNTQPRQGELAEMGTDLSALPQQTAAIETLAIDKGWDPTWDSLYSSHRLVAPAVAAGAAAPVDGPSLPSLSMSTTDIDAQIEYLRKMKELKDLQAALGQMGAAPLVDAVPVGGIVTVAGAAAVVAPPPGGAVQMNNPEELARLAEQEAMAAVGRRP